MISGRLRRGWCTKSNSTIRVVARAMRLCCEALADHAGAMEWLTEARMRCTREADTYVALLVEDHSAAPAKPEATSGRRCGGVDVGEVADRFPAVAGDAPAACARDLGDQPVCKQPSVARPAPQAAGIW